VPVRGELVPGPNAFEAEVLDADPRRVKRAKIYRRKDRRAMSPRDLPALLKASRSSPRDEAERSSSNLPQQP
jgi:hypothetical protein